MSRDVQRAVLARFITNTGAEAAFFVGMWGKAAYEFQAGPSALAVMTVLIAVASVLGNVTGGLLVDRQDARRVMIVTEILLVPATLVLLLANDLTSLFSLGVFTFLLHGVEETAATSLPPALVDDVDEALVAVNARLESAGWLAMVAGPGIGGLIAGFLALDVVFWFDAGTSVVSVLLLLTVRLRAHPDEEPGALPTSGLADIREGFRLARQTKPIALAMVIGSLLWFGFGAFVSLEPLYYRDVLEVGPEVLGYVNAIFGMGLFAGSLGVDRWGRRFGFTEAMWLAALTGLGSIVYVGTASLWVVVIGAIVWAVPLGMIFPIVRTLAQRAAPPGAVGRVMGSIATVQNLASLLPTAFVPWLAVSFGVQAVLIGGGLVPILALPLLLIPARRLDAASAGGELEMLPNPHPTSGTPLP